VDGFEAGFGAAAEADIAGVTGQAPDGPVGFEAQALDAGGPVGVLKKLDQIFNVEPDCHSTPAILGSSFLGWPPPVSERDRKNNFEKMNLGGEYCWVDVCGARSGWLKRGMRMKIQFTAVVAVLGFGMVHAAAAATLPARAPGLWQSTTTVTGADGKPLPNATNVVTVSCVDPATDIKFFTSNGSSCTSLDISGSGTKYAINGSCTQRGKPVQIHETLDYASPQSVKLQAKVELPVGVVTVSSQLQWQGDCLAGMVPGDEGNIVSGAFSKADNINDSGNL
jgi:hypothetical protein